MLSPNSASGRHVRLRATLALVPALSLSALLDPPLSRADLANRVYDPIDEFYSSGWAHEDQRRLKEHEREIESVRREAARQARRAREIDLALSRQTTPPDKNLPPKWHRFTDQILACESSFMDLLRPKGNQTITLARWFAHLDPIPTRDLDVYRFDHKGRPLHSSEHRVFLRGYHKIIGADRVARDSSGVFMLQRGQRPYFFVAMEGPGFYRIEDGFTRRPRVNRFNIAFLGTPLWSGEPGKYSIDRIALKDASLPLQGPARPFEVQAAWPGSELKFRTVEWELREVPVGDRDPNSRYYDERSLYRHVKTGSWQETRKLSLGGEVGLSAMQEYFGRDVYWRLGALENFIRQKFVPLEQVLREKQRKVDLGRHALAQARKDLPRLIQDKRDYEARAAKELARLRAESAAIIPAHLLKTPSEYSAKIQRIRARIQELTTALPGLEREREAALGSVRQMRAALQPIFGACAGIEDGRVTGRLRALRALAGEVKVFPAAGDPH